MLHKDNGTADRNTGSVMAQMPGEVVDFTAWRRAHPLPAAGTTTVEAGSAVIVPFFQERLQSLPAFDYSGDAAKIVATRLGLSPQPPTASQPKASQPVRAVRTGSAAAHKWDPRNWPSGLSWLVKNMADGMIDMNNLQAMLSDMQQELDALESSMDRLRGDGVTELEPNDLELVAPPELNGPRRACDMTGRPIDAAATDVMTTEMTTGD